jgi:hypothetical protein
VKLVIAATVAGIDLQSPAGAAAGPSGGQAKISADYFPWAQLWFLCYRLIHRQLPALPALVRQWEIRWEVLPNTALILAPGAYIIAGSAPNWTTDICRKPTQSSMSPPACRGSGA